MKDVLVLISEYGWIQHIINISLASSIIFKDVEGSGDQKLPLVWPEWAVPLEEPYCAQPDASSRGLRAVLSYLSCGFVPLLWPHSVGDAVKLILVTYCTSPNTPNVLLFQTVINVKIINELFPIGLTDKGLPPPARPRSLWPQRLRWVGYQRRDLQVWLEPRIPSAPCAQSSGGTCPSPTLPREPRHPTLQKQHFKSFSHAARDF